MTEFFGLLLDRPETLRRFECEDELTAPDEYVRQFVRLRDGSVAFVEVTRNDQGPWELWRVECIGVSLCGAVTGCFTARCSEAEARAEIELASRGGCPHG